MTTAARLARLMYSLPKPSGFFIVHPGVLRMIARSRGFWLRAFDRRPGVRGRKRALSVRRRLA